MFPSPREHFLDKNVFTQGTSLSLSPGPGPFPAPSIQREVLVAPDCLPAAAADVYAFGALLWELGGF